MNERTNPNPDGLGAQDLGFAVLASGNVAVVEPNGDVSDIIDAGDWYSDLRVARAEWDRA